ncbi:PfkB family carbohydrate kinase [Maribacter confluentis]|uniref:PfkB family carbohydrate kinase n=1 Tax=Maribacter confluentis TaxID=1656093 RepID=A0ABT8RMC8_9FLAO|nr:PfkB family carbohydrate kinase [Maribacter confluentis]MDO1511622.1 PfkB family carbohydrate kinase [Maribacter confluentis]MDO1514877.1 PfkB family carbohydrate kinase [Maribacter confluentis]
MNITIKNRIFTFTVNPVVNGIVPDNKLRCGNPVYEPGEGVINVSRVIKELGGTSLCMYISGGPKGIHLQEQLTDLQIDQQIIPISGWVRENHAVADTKNNAQYRFGMPGPLVKKTEWQRTLIQLDAVIEEDDFLVASGSMVAEMVLAFSKNKSIKEMGIYGVACGTAATMKEGSQLCKKNDVDELKIPK